jgi:hypothetical protein
MMDLPVVTIKESGEECGIRMGVEQQNRVRPLPVDLPMLVVTLGPENHSKRLMRLSADGRKYCFPKSVSNFLIKHHK